MDETTKASIERITIRYDRPTRIPSGQVATVYYDCFQLAPSELARLAVEAIGDLDHDLFEAAVGLSYSGILYAAAVAGGRTVGIVQKNGELFGPSVSGKRVVVVDDVVHSGNRLKHAGKKIESLGGLVVGYVCIVDRSSGGLGTPPAIDGKPLWSAFQSDME